MKVLLLYPPISKFERYGSSLGNSGGDQIPLGIFYLASYLREMGHQVQVIDAEAQKLDQAEILARIAEFGPGLVGIGSTTVAFHRALEAARAVKAAYPEVPIVLGGPHITSNPEHAMAHAEFDYGIIGEGELVLLELISALESRTGLEGIKSLVHRGPDGPVINPRQEMIKDLDAMPMPSYDLIPDLAVYRPPPCNYQKKSVANIITSRGCPYKCTFCDRNIFGSRLRQRSAQSVAAEIDYLYNQRSIREIAFVDDTFTIGHKRLREIFRILDEKGIKISWTCLTRVNQVDEDILAFMKAKGCWHISFGIESGDPEILELIRKDISLDQVQRVAEWCRKLGIRTKGFFMVGHPGETKQSLDQTIEYALGLPLDDVVVTVNTPIPGTLQYQQAEKYGSLNRSDWSQYNYHRPVFVPRGLDEGLLLAKRQEFYRRFYLRPRIMWRYFTSFFCSSGPARFWSLLISVPYLFKREKGSDPA